MTTDREDLLGPEPPAQGAPGRHGHAVSISWLSKVFRMDKMTVKIRLADCAPWSTVGAYPVYDIAQAAAYLIPPCADITAHMKSLDPATLLPHLSNEFWSAKVQRQKWEREAADLWRHEDVIDVFAEVFNRIEKCVHTGLQKFGQEATFTDKQRSTLAGMAEGILDDLRVRLVDAPAARQERNETTATDESET